eukprot:m.244458 g.244458  ORF g.244458 m.244458 type:complete len:1041 (-) comp19037_c0_seq4:34-3156(-)
MGHANSKPDAPLWEPVKCGKEDAEAHILTFPPGAFFMRESRPGTYHLVVNDHGSAQQFLIQRDDEDMLSMGKQKFRDFQALVKFLWQRGIKGKHGKLQLGEAVGFMTAEEPSPRRELQRHGTSLVRDQSTWFAGTMPFERAEPSVFNGQEGDYLVTESPFTPGEFTLLAKGKGKVCRCTVVRNQDGTYTHGTQSFASVNDLVDIILKDGLSGPSGTTKLIRPIGSQVKLTTSAGITSSEGSVESLGVLGLASGEELATASEVDCPGVPAEDRRAPWFAGALSKTEGEALVSSAASGDFLIRKSQTQDGLFHFVVNDNGSPMHYKIEHSPEDSQFCLAGMKFDNLTAVVELLRARGIKGRSQKIVLNKPVVLPKPKATPVAARSPLVASAQPSENEVVSTGQRGRVFTKWSKPKRPKSPAPQSPSGNNEVASASERGRSGTSWTKPSAFLRKKAASPPSDTGAGSSANTQASPSERGRSLTNWGFARGKKKKAEAAAAASSAASSSPSSSGSTASADSPSASSPSPMDDVSPPTYPPSPHVSSNSEVCFEALDVERFLEMPRRSTASDELPNYAIGKQVNRYRNVLPNPVTRVRLGVVGGDSATEYINANFVRGFGQRNAREYIAAQAPMATTLESFLRMIWEQNISTIAMLTGLKEKGRKKCERYWPETPQSDPLVFGKITVATTAVLRKEGYVVSTLKLSRKSFTTETREVIHFWFDTWPDHGVPTDSAGDISSDAMVEMILAVRTCRASRVTTLKRGGPELAPALVHCSAGIGRTGTFIIVDQILSAIQAGVSTIDVLTMIDQIRQDRMSMVQETSQLKFAFQAGIDIAGKYVTPERVFTETSQADAIRRLRRSESWKPVSSHDHKARFQKLPGKLRVELESEQSVLTMEDAVGSSTASLDVPQVGGQATKPITPRLTRKQQPLELQPYYRSGLSREQIEQTLHDTPTGTFLVRPSSVPGHFALTMNEGEGKIVSLLIVPVHSDDKTRYKLGQTGQQVFETIPQLVAFFEENPVRADSHGEHIRLIDHTPADDDDGEC